MDWHRRGVFVKTVHNEVAVSEFGAHQNIDCTVSMNKASNVCLAESARLVIDVDCTIYQVFYIYTDVLCNRKIICRSAGYVQVSRQSDYISASPIIADMVRGRALSGQIGYSGYTIVAMSTEKLIDRVGNDGGAPYYMKEETAVIVADSGTIQPPWMHTYTDSSKLTIMLYPPDREITVNLVIEYFDTDISNFAVLRVARSNCVLEDIKITVTGNKSNANIGIFLVDSANVEIVRHSIQGFQSTLGYGIHQLRTANVNLSDGRITECRRPVANRFDKNTWVWRGFYRSSGAVSCIDSHWGDGVHVRGIKGYCKSKSALDFAGYNASVKDCELIDVLYIIGNRPDTPAWGGNIIAENNTVHSTRDLFSYFGNQSIGLDYANAFDWELPWPDLMYASNNTVNITDANWSLLRLNDSRFERTQIKKIVIKNNRYNSTLHPMGLVQLSCRALDTHPTYKSAAGLCEIYIEEQAFAPGTGFGLLDIEQHGAVWKWDIKLKYVTDLYFRLDCDIATRVLLDGGDFIGARTKTFRSIDDPAREPSFYFELRGITVRSTALLYNSANQIMAFNCVYLPGSLIYSIDELDSKPISSDRYSAFAVAMGNIAIQPISAAGALPPLDGWVTENIYTRQALIKHVNGSIPVSDLGKFGIGYREDTQQLVVVNRDGEVKRINTI